MNALYISKILKRCEAVADFKISIDFLDKTPPGISIRLDDVKNTQRVYCDGERIYTKEAELEIRLYASDIQNAESKRIIEELCDELAGMGKSIAFPTPSNGVIPLKIEITDGAALISDEIHSAKYTLKFKIYFMEKRG